VYCKKAMKEIVYFIWTMLAQNRKGMGAETFRLVPTTFGSAPPLSKLEFDILVPDHGGGRRK
jgi:hypothetical protein